MDFTYIPTSILKCISSEKFLNLFINFRQGNISGGARTDSNWETSGPIELPGGECQLASESQLRIVPLPNAITGLRANELHAADPYAHDAGKKEYLLEK